MRINWFCAFMLLSFSVWGQEDTLQRKKFNLKYFNQFQAGLLLGKKDNVYAFSGSVVQGIRLKNLSLGAGIGIEGYDFYKTTPLFGVLSYDFALHRRKKGQGLFLQLQYGYAWANRLEDVGPWVAYYKDFGGKYFSPLLGFRWGTGSRMRMYFLVGYNRQIAGYEYGYEVWGGRRIFHYEEKFSRAVFKIGLGIN